MGNLPPSPAPYAWEAPESFVVTPETTFEVYDGSSDPYVAPNKPPSITFNPYTIGVSAYLSNVWATALEKAKQNNSQPVVTMYEKPSQLGSGAANTGFGGVVGWFQGIPEYFVNLRKQDQEDWIDYKADLEDRKQLNHNVEGQQVITDIDIEDPWMSFAGASGKVSEDPSIFEGAAGVIKTSSNTFEDFVSGVKTGFEATSGIMNYKYPLMIAGGIILLILIVK